MTPRSRWPAWLPHLLVGLLVAALATDAEAQRRRRPPGGNGTLTIQTTMEGAEVLIDEETVGFTPLDPISLSPGSHTLRVRRPGYTELTEVVEIAPGQNVDMPVDLLALAMVLTVRTEPDEARVFVDGTFRGTTPIEIEVVEGERSIRVTHPTHREVVRTITAVAGQTQALDLTLEPIPPEELGAARAPEWYEEPVVWISIGAGVAVVAIAIVLVAVLTQGGPQVDPFCAEEANCIRIRPEWQF